MEGMPPPLWHPQKYNFELKFGGHCTQDKFCMQQIPLAYMAVFCQASFEPGPSSPELSALPKGPLQLPFFLVCNEDLGIKRYLTKRSLKKVFNLKF